ncbi:MAG: GxxExxY protein [Chitinophagaceae bacterium]|nr:GxxExxY protein [Chitinophagaceae bacterium]
MTEFSGENNADAFCAVHSFVSMELNDISQTVIGAAIEIHKQLGPGLLESVYVATLTYDLQLLGLKAEMQVPLPVVYKEVLMEVGFRVDILVNDKVIVEVKSVEALAPVHYSQLLTYLRLADKRLGLLINFNSDVLKNGIHRVVNKF